MKIIIEMEPGEVCRDPVAQQTIDTLYETGKMGDFEKFIKITYPDGVPIEVLTRMLTTRRRDTFGIVGLKYDEL